MPSARTPRSKDHGSPARRRQGGQGPLHRRVVVRLTVLREGLGATQIAALAKAHLSAAQLAALAALIFQRPAAARPAIFRPAAALAISGSGG